MNSESRAQPSGARARAGWLATTLILAAALLVSSWTNYRAARAAVQTLNTGQAEILASAIRGAEFQGGLEGDLEALEAVLESQFDSGLRYIALLESDGSVNTSAGEPVGAVALPAQLQPGVRFSGPIIVPQGERVQAFLFRPGDRGQPQFRMGGDPDFRGRGQPPAGGPRDTITWGQAGGRGGPGAGFGGRFQFYLLEFEPVASEVIGQAVRGLILNGLGAGLLTLLALVFWQGSLRNEEAQKQIEQQKRLSQLGEMSAVLAHEIRNPLASLKGNAQLLAEGLEDGSKERRRADRVVGEAVRLETLTTDLLDFARSAPITRIPTDPADLLRSAVQDVSEEIQIEASAAPRIWGVDRSRLRQALTNLLRNAWQISPQGRPPVATVAQLNDQLVFTIRDFGPGLQPGDLKRIFEPFYTTRTHGTGLGLPVARRAVELHNGTIDAENHPEGGAVFRITLPNGAD